MGRKQAKKVKELENSMHRMHHRMNKMEIEHSKLRSIILISDYEDYELDRASGG